MGTGIMSITLHDLPYNAKWLQYISYVFFGLNILLFTVFLGLSIARYTVYPKIWWAMISHPAQSLFLGCFPMAFASECRAFMVPLSSLTSRSMATNWPSVSQPSSA
jgi:tellurite resistance protein TehA-like permease